MLEEKQLSSVSSVKVFDEVVLDQDAAHFFEK